MMRHVHINVIIPTIILFVQWTNQQTIRQSRQVQMSTTMEDWQSKMDALGVTFARAKSQSHAHTINTEGRKKEEKCPFSTKWGKWERVKKKMKKNQKKSEHPQRAFSNWAFSDRSHNTRDKEWLFAVDVDLISTLADKIENIEMYTCTYTHRKDVDKEKSVTFHLISLIASFASRDHIWHFLVLLIISKRIVFPCNCIFNIQVQYICTHTYIPIDNISVFQLHTSFLENIPQLLNQRRRQLSFSR